MKSPFEVHFKEVDIMKKHFGRLFRSKEISLEIKKLVNDETIQVENAEKQFTIVGFTFKKNSI